MFILAVNIILFANIINAYPVIVSDSGLNHTKNVELVNSIPDKYLKHIDTISFINSAWAKCRIYGSHNQSICWKGWYWAYWTKSHDCHHTKIILSSNEYDILEHELGHVYELCELKKDYSTEEFAIDFRIK